MDVAVLDPAVGEEDAVRALRTDDVVWSVPGQNAIAGVYEGVEATMDYSPIGASWPRGRSSCTQVTCWSETDRGSLCSPTVRR